MLTYYPYWDISYLVAILFTLGSVVWIINSFMIYLPFRWPWSEIHGQVLYGGGITAFVGATIFEVGGVLMMLEAVNSNRQGCFGMALEKFYEAHFSRREEEGVAVETKIVPCEGACSHHHRNTKTLVSTSGSRQNTMATDAGSTASTKKIWVWWLSASDLENHYLRELGFLACLILLVSATVFYVSGVTALPGIFNNMSHTEIAVFYWTPQTIGGIGFVISGLMFTIETQKHW